MATILSDVEMPSTLHPDAVAALRRQLGGSLFLPGEDGYDAARAIWNGMIAKRPALIVRPSGVADVRRAVAFAREHDLPLSIKGGGHNVAGLAIADGGLMLNLGAMRGVRVDPERRTARVEGGATWADVDRATAAFSLATTGGAVSTTGVGGLTLGGGVGWLVGKHGMTIDNLLSVDLVTADGCFVTASAEENPDLFWALRGGGGNFGVVTSFEFRLHPLDRVFAGLLLYPIEAAGAVLERFREFTTTAPDELTAYFALATRPDLGGRVCGFALCYAGDPAAGERVIAPLRLVGRPLLDQVGAQPYPTWQASLDALSPHGRCYYWKSSLYRELPDAVLAAIAEHGANSPLATTKLFVEHYHGAFNRPGIADTAYPHRDVNYQVVISGSWIDAADDAAAIAWVRETFAATASYAKPSQFLNFNVIDAADRQRRIRAGYGPNWDRLVEVKRRYDPTNFFRENNNIAP